MQRRALLFLLVQFTVVSASTCATESTSYQQMMLDDTICFRLFHRVQGQEIFLRLVAKHDGWLGFGLAEQGSGHMKGADIVTAQVTNGNVMAQDRYVPFAAWDGTSYTGLYAAEDVVNDWTILEGYRIDGEMVVVLKRLLNTNDPQDRPVIPGSQRIIWAWGSGNTVSYHGNRGATIATFVAGTSVLDVPTGGGNGVTGSWQFKFDGFPLPPSRTTYACQSFSVPTDRKRHVVGFRPLIDKTAHVHHYVLHICDAAPTYHAAHERSRECIGGGGSQCGGFMWSWAKGQGDFWLPDAAGFAVGQ
eukprot:CAMPEP_0117069238 /NCGR_PEP_ID=MMETSP0472-20121206/48557_1 /TAXON_ID=693140 ORGANISM="Tiarina fusus, Strain LIS" /NCGR_SAMPLE_ID=MMETSP0472 /ASSEMBLY_ACC=CAM_ASM_000603 /LENGTH=302 /DNA_ID=CAMNT_0004791685 /DNA_START=8 /DNA_END=913 /DNA_ORIENTATION=+